jgi:hypothetical protein
MSNIDEFTAQHIRRAALRDYHAFMALDATFNQIRDFLAVHCCEIHVDWCGGIKSDIANAYAIRDYKFTENHLEKLRKQFGDWKEKQRAEQAQYGTKGVRQRRKLTRSTTGLKLAEVE